MNVPADLELVLLPGLDGTGLLFEPLLKALPADLKLNVVAYPPQDALTYAQLAEHVREQLPHGRSLVLCAESFSGPIAIQLAHSERPNVKGIIFCATFARSPRPFLLNLARWLPLAILFRLGMPRILVRMFLLDRGAPESLVQLFEQSISVVSPATLAARMREVATVDVSSELENIEVPCCFIRAESDALVPRRCVRPFEEGIAGLVVKDVPGPHLILQANPSRCSRLISEFLNALRTR